LQIINMIYNFLMNYDLLDGQTQRREVAPEFRCRGTRRDGEPCRAAATRTGYCAAHSGLGWAASSEAARAAQRASMRAYRANAAKRRQAEEQKKRSLASSLRARAVEHREAILDVLFAPIFDESLTPKVRQEAALKIWERAFGRPGQSPAIPEGHEIEDMTIDELVEAWDLVPDQVDPPAEPYVARTHTPHPD
jgi:hypothetical protein